MVEGTWASSQTFPWRLFLCKPVPEGRKGRPLLIPEALSRGEGGARTCDFIRSKPSAWAPFSPVCGREAGLRTDDGGLFLPPSSPCAAMARMNKTHRR
jgi:hypothetical protein